MARKSLVKSTETAVKRILMVMMICPVVGLAQVGIGVTGSVNASAKLQVDAANKGFLPPRVALTGTSDVSTIASPATGLLVYNTATAGTSPANVTPGFYYYDGAKWQRVINQQPDATISFDKTTPTSSGVVFTPNTPNSTDYIYVSSVDNTQWTYNGSAYVTYTPPASTPWMLSGNTTDAGSNKSGSVFRTGSVTIGGQTTSPVTTVASSAQLEVISTTKGFLPPRMTSAQREAISAPATGLVVYQTNGTAGLYYYNGTTWLTLTTHDKRTFLKNHVNASTTLINGPSNVSNWTGSYAASGGDVVVTASFSAYASSVGQRTFRLTRDGVIVATREFYFNSTATHHAIPTITAVFENESGTHTYGITIESGITVDQYDYCTILVTESNIF